MIYLLKHLKQKNFDFIVNRKKKGVELRPKGNIDFGKKKMGRFNEKFQKV